MTKKTYTPAEAIEEQNTVKITLWGHPDRVFNMGIIDVLDGGDKLYVARFTPKGKIFRKEILHMGYGYGCVRAVSGPDCKHIFKGTSGDRVLSYQNDIRTRRLFKKSYNTLPIVNDGEMRHDPDFLMFKKQQAEFRKGQDLDAKILSRKISEFEEKQKIQTMQVEQGRKDLKSFIEDCQFLRGTA